MKKIKETGDKYKIADDCRIKFATTSGIKLKIYILQKKAHLPKTVKIVTVKFGEMFPSQEVLIADWIEYYNQSK